MDRKSVLVLIVCAVLFLLWAQLTPRLYPPKPIARTNSVAGPSNALAGVSNSVPSLEAATTTATAYTPPRPGAPEELLVLTNELARYTFTSHGGGRLPARRPNRWA